MPNGFQHLHSCPLPVLAKQKRDSQFTVKVGILSVKFERCSQMINGLIQPALSPQLYRVLNQLTELDVSFGAAESRTCPRVGSAFCLVPIEHYILAGTRRKKEGLLFFIGATDVEVVVSRLNFSQY
jgi:hypothetical protein